MTDVQGPKIIIDETTRLLRPLENTSDYTDGSSSSSSSIRSATEGPTPITKYGSPVASDEEQCQPEESPSIPSEEIYSSRFIVKVVVALLVGVFASNADGSLVIATHAVIASEFNDLEDSSWLLISFLLAGAATQSLYGKLSDIYGRKSVLLACYALFIVGCALIGIGQSMWQVILGRIISGSGGSGMTTLAAVIIADISPLRDVASWQSYVNVVATVGRSLGGPVGGFLADTIGWRWSFFGQAPIFILAMILCGAILPNLTPRHNQNCVESARSRVARIDFLGAAFLGSGILALLLPLKIAGDKVPWFSLTVFSLFALGSLLMVLFVVTEARWAKEPIFPLRLVRNRPVVVSYLITICQTAAQLGLMFTIPLYFQVTERSSSTVAGAHLIPAVIGNTVGGLVTGVWIRRTGDYKAPLVFAGAVSFSCYGLLILRWHGNTNWVESLYVFPGGFGTGISLTAVFIALQAAIDPADKAVAAAGLYLTIPVGQIVGTAACNAAMQTMIPIDLASRLHDLGIDQYKAQEIIKKAVARVDYLDEAPQAISQAVAESYVRGLEYAHGISLISAVFATGGALLLGKGKLNH
ncbi:major facilitator superfamily domain-containing protein [Xylariaceae sp. FL0662B]|nr:major facilitator superfamily domain-containing protein [Xylariaceae sp. FL0662B]